VIYLDSSVALAQLLREPRRPADTLWGRSLVSSKLLEYEIWNRVHAYRLSGSLGEQARQLLARVVLIKLDDPVLARALEPFPMSLRTLDSLHLATMDFIIRSGEAVDLASYDNRLIAAAEALGIPIATL
jgi:uncharacterized protein